MWDKPLLNGEGSAYPSKTVGRINKASVKLLVNAWHIADAQLIILTDQWP